MRHPLIAPITARFNVENVFDANNWASVNAGTLIQGTPCTFRLSATANF